MDIFQLIGDFLHLMAVIMLLLKILKKFKTCFQTTLKWCLLLQEWVAELVLVLLL